MLRALTKAAAISTLLILGAGATFVLWPLPPGLLERHGLVSLRITDRTGATLRELRSREDGRSLPLPQGEIPERLRLAFLAAEDKRFDSHPGVDPLAVARAALQNLRAGRIESGASTLTMQLARRLRPRPRTLPGKIGEALWALRLTARLPRERVLREYLDRVPLGNSAIGVEAAAHLYFARPASRLSTGQAALLAGMARAPASLDPFRHPDRARRRMRQVLGRMRALGFITEDEARVATETPLDLVPAERAFRAAHLTTAIERALPRLGLDAAARIETTLDPALQAAVEEAIREELAGLQDRRVGQAAVLVVDNATGEVLAYVGSADFFDDERFGQNDGVRALRQPGSALKPFAYGLALASGYTPATVLSDLETHLATPSGSYVPKNYDRRVHGPVRLRAALANSYNVPAVKLAEELGPDRVLDVLRRAGFDSLADDASHYGVGIVLGNGDVTLRELARAYRGLARGGVVGPLVEIRAASDAEGRPLPIPRELEPRRFLAAEVVNLLTDMLADEQARSPAFGIDNSLRLPFPVAAKTGTSRAHVDNWAAGFTRERTVAVWVGNFEGTPMRGVSGITGAGPLFKRVMLLAMRGIAPAPLIDRSRFEAVDICPLSGHRAGPACPAALSEVFLPRTAPAQPCSMHRRDGLDVGPEFCAWARAEGLEAGPWSGDVATGDGAGDSSRAARLLMPSDGDEYLLEPEYPAADQTVPVRAVPPAGVAALEIRLDDGSRLALAAPFATRIGAGRGAHRLELWVPGQSEPAAVARFVVR